ncbi:hypothetical protein B0H13DRAFT_2174518, partial [Mycena leptocephala]
MLPVPLSKHRDRGRGRQISGCVSSTLKPRSSCLAAPRRPSSSMPSGPYLPLRPHRRGRLRCRYSLWCPRLAAGWRWYTRRVRVEPEPRFVLLEEWVLAFTASSASSTSTSAASTSFASASSVSDTGSASTSRSSSMDDESSADVLPPTIYRNAIPLFARCARCYASSRRGGWCASSPAGEHHWVRAEVRRASMDCGWWCDCGPSRARGCEWAETEEERRRSHSANRPHPRR